MQSSQVVGVRKYVLYFLFIFLSGLLSAVDYFSNKTLSNFIPQQVNLISNFQIPDRLLQNEFSSLSSSRADLVAENIRLKEELTNLRVLYLENQELQDNIESYELLVKNISDFELTYYATSLILKNSTDEYLISGGRNYNFEPGDLVINETGYIVGYLGEVFNDYSILESFNSTNFNFRAIDVNNNIFEVNSNGKELVFNSLESILNSKVGMLYSDITFGHINKFPFYDLEPYEQTKLNNKFTVIVPIEKMITFQSKLFIPKSK
jgi:cell shape-determining protein MreC